MILTQNPNWPVLRLRWSPTTNGVYDSNPALYTDITLRCLKQWSVRGGLQYELGQTQPRRFATTLNNRDGVFNPVSASSPFAPGVLPERSLVLEAQWPPTQQLITPDMATAGDYSLLPLFEMPASFQASSFYGTPLIEFSSTAWQGTQVYQVSVPASAPAGHTLLQFANQPVIAPTFLYPALPYSWSVWVRSNTAGANPVVRAALAWKNSVAAVASTVTAATVTLTGSATVGWQRLTISGSPPAGALAVDVVVQLASAGPGVAWLFQADGLQFEQNTASTTWTQPNPWYPIFTGNTDVAPKGADLSGTRAISRITATDALGMLSRSVITASLTGLIGNPAGDNSLAGAVFNYYLGDAGSNQYSDLLGNRNYGQGLPGKAGIGTITAGIAVTSSIDGEDFLGTSQTCVSFTAPGGPGGGSSAAMSAIALPPGPNGQYGPGGGSGLGYTRMIAFKCTSAPTSNASVLWYSANLGPYAQGVALMPGGSVVASVEDQNHGSTTTIGTYDVGGWHLAWLGVAADGSSFLAGIDSTVASHAAGALNYAFPAGFADELLGAQGVSASNPHALQFNFQGDLALYVEWPELLTPAAIASIYQAWRTGYTGDSTGGRAENILTWAKYKGQTAIDTGSTLSLGPATDVDDIDAVTSLQNVVETEGGSHFMSAGGAYTLYGRARTLGAYVPVFKFGSNTAAGEIPFEDVDFDFGITNVNNDIAITQVSTLQTVYSVNQDSVSKFGASTVTQSNQSTNIQDCQDQADWIAGVDGYPRIRVASMTLHPAANPALLWPVCLALDFGMFVQVTDRPMGSQVGALDPVTMTGFVANIQATGTDGADATWVVQIAEDAASGAGPSRPAAHPWLLALLHTTLNQPAAAGTNSITIDALPTAATSTLDQNLPGGGPGMSFVVGSGLTTQETLTILSVSPTVLGYTTATITFTANLANNHAAKEIVREPRINADVHNWPSLDAYSTLGSCMIAY